MLISLEKKDLEILQSALYGRLGRLPANSFNRSVLEDLNFRLARRLLRHIEEEEDRKCNRHA